MALKSTGWVRDPQARLFVGVSLASGFGGSALSLAAPVWVLALTGSSALAALAGFCVYLPTLAAPVLGAVVDRVPRRALLIGTHLVLAAILPLLLFVHTRQDGWLIFAVMLCCGTGYVLGDAGESALLPAAVPADELGGLNGVRMSAQESMKIVAPLAGAGLFAWAGGGAVAVLSAAAHLVSAWCYTRVRPVRVPGSPAGDRRVRDGIRLLWSDREIRVPVLVAAVAVPVSGLVTAAFYTLVTHGLGRPAAFAGVLASVQGIGSVAGGLAAGRIMGRLGEARFAVAGVLVCAVGHALRAIPVLPCAIGANLLAGIGLPWTVVAAFTAVQRRTPAGALGRVSASALTLIFAPIAVATPLGAGLESVLDYRIVMLLAALLTATSALLLRITPENRCMEGKQAVNDPMTESLPS
ncbi:MFS transporter [Hamadaea tsunoensis]|uniref:MFS transporter n=1 Tax=Hamadaea tsunoensis TaxID=53368 RepID=UPI0004281C25|nr:MFS transporter [Hamadaea tsunoensis]